MSRPKRVSTKGTGAHYMSNKDLLALMQKDGLLKKDRKDETGHSDKD